MSLTDVTRLTPIKELLPNEIDWNQLKVILAIIQYRFGMSSSAAEDMPSCGNQVKSANEGVSKTFSAHS